jgi:endonuclease VIII
MPEGPEIRRAADRLAAAVLGRPLLSAFFAFPALKRHEKSLVGRRIEAIIPRGKALLTRFDHGWTLYSHNQLYGVWKVAKAGQRPQTSRSLRVALETATRAILLYSASDVALLRHQEVEQIPFLQRLGPDVLDGGLSVETVAARLIERRFAGRSLAALLLDQAFLAGMGNYLRSEVLHQAGVAPQRRARDLDQDTLQRLASALLDVPRRSYLTRGIRATRGMRSDYLTDTPEGFRMRVFGRTGEPCEGCGRPVEREERAGRRLYWCPRCQQ